ncbi:GtrA-like protein [Anaerobiospirillum thomasii]|uniref:GtrA-like protein n=1 Tax=Anaerobiospirillum thomasii TaxID=179995 RepID=A0A2X0V6N1_9GAMM|nr:GtrA family protein [Anaerobiospirillum thomasii]SPT68425.1 GtrA-like protein [Anaerobiospirillum thomasii]SPT70931.1 GtrA-like protein [Anaerobiospirillum thomasii]
MKGLNLKDNKSSHIFEIVRFILVGSAATLTDLIISAALIYMTPLSENAITTIAFAIAFFVSYFGHKNYTFKKDGKMLSFLALALGMLLLRNIIVYYLVLYVIAGLPALVIAMIFVTGITYLVSKFFVFK